VFFFFFFCHLVFIGRVTNPLTCRRHLQTCSTGSEATDWIVDKFNVSRVQAVELGQKMLGMVRCCLNLNPPLVTSLVEIDRVAHPCTVRGVTVPQGFFEHVSDQNKPFEDANEFYRFVDTEAAGPQVTENTTLYDFNALDIDKNPVSLSEFAGRYVLVVNVASF
jgi:hypothetical protein